MTVRGISQTIINALVEKTLALGQGRNAGCIGFIDEEGIISSSTDIVAGGVSGLPLRQLLNRIVPMAGRSLLEGIENLPGNSVIITTRPGKTGLITDLGGIDFFDVPVLAVGVKGNGLAGVGIMNPQARLFDMATEAEELNLQTLSARTIAEERDILWRITWQTLDYLNAGSELPVSAKAGTFAAPPVTPRFSLPKLAVRAIDRKMAEELVAKSMEVGQGREVAAIGLLDNDGVVRPKGRLVVGGIGFIPNRLLAGSLADLRGRSLRRIYAEEIPPEAVVVHTHPGGTGVMHLGDINAVPLTWGRPIAAIGHDEAGQIRGATVAHVTERALALAEEDEQLGNEFFEADTPEEEARVRNRRFGIAQDYTDLCEPVEIV